jgi:hypothetical protein
MKKAAFLVLLVLALCAAFVGGAAYGVRRAVDSVRVLDAWEDADGGAVVLDVCGAVNVYGYNVE